MLRGMGASVAAEWRGVREDDEMVEEILRTICSTSYNTKL